MNSDIRLSVEFFDHPKTVKLQRRLGLEGVISLQRLWIWTAQNRSSGLLSTMDVESIEIVSRWGGEEGLFVATLVRVGFVDDCDGVYSLHDWAIHQPYAVAEQERQDKARKGGLAKHRNALARKEQELSKCREDNKICSCSAQTLLNSCSEQNQAMLQTKPNHVRRKTDTTYLARSDADASSVPEPSEQDRPIAFIPLADGSEFAVSDSLAQEYAAAYPGVSVLSEIGKARAWCLSNPKHRKTKNGVRRFLNAWLDRAQNTPRASPAYRSVPQATTVGQQRSQEREQMARMLLEAENGNGFQRDASIVSTSCVALPAGGQNAR